MKQYLFLFILSYFICNATAIALPKKCPPECSLNRCPELDVESCVYGYGLDNCNCCATCLKGPGEECGTVPGFVHCGEGMTCCHEHKGAAYRPGYCKVNKSKCTVRDKRQIQPKPPPPGTSGSAGQPAASTAPPTTTPTPLARPGSFVAPAILQAHRTAWNNIVARQDAKIKKRRDDDKKRHDQLMSNFFYALQKRNASQSSSVSGTSKGTTKATVATTKPTTPTTPTTPSTPKTIFSLNPAKNARLQRAFRIQAERTAYTQLKKQRSNALLGASRGQFPSGFTPVSTTTLKPGISKTEIRNNRRQTAQQNLLQRRTENLQKRLKVLQLLLNRQSGSTQPPTTGTTTKRTVIVINGGNSTTPKSVK